MLPQDRIRRDRISVMRRVKESAEGKMRDRMRRAMKGKRGALKEMEESVDADVEKGFIEECDRLRRKYALRPEKCVVCDGKRRCPKCKGERGKEGLFGFSKCRECKGTGVCRGCLRNAQQVLDTLEMAEKYAAARAVAGGEDVDTFKEVLRRLGLSIEEAALYQHVLNVALGAR